MSDHKKHNKQYSAEDIQRYLAGGMSAAEMHAIESAALDDPFLADAIDGFQGATVQKGQDAVAAEMNQLRTEFSRRIAPASKVIRMKRSAWWQVAAASAILIVGILAINNRWFQAQTSTEDKLAVTQKKPDTIENAQTERATKASATGVDTTNAPAADAVAEKSEGTGNRVEPSSDFRRPNELAKQERQSTAPPSKDHASNKVELATTENSEREKERKEPVVVAPAQAEPYARDKKSDESSTADIEPLARKNQQLAGQLNNFSGRVLDANNNPLANASLQVMTNKANVITDESGNFNFSAADSIVDVKVALPGFEQRNFRLQNSIASNNLVLEPNAENLKEVVVVGYGTQRKKDVTAITGKVQNAVPDIGWLEYEKYLEKNKKAPVNNPLMTGEVVVSFQVKRAGVLSDFKVEKSLSKDHDIEAVRLIKEGPSWKLLNDRKTRITVIVKF